LEAREWALLAAIAYADLFDSPLLAEEAPSTCPGLVLDSSEVRKIVASPRLRRLVTLHSSGYLTLAGRENLVTTMPERVRLTRQLLERNRPTLRALAALPFVRSILLSGGVAHRNPGKRPDVDLFVVAARGHAYTAYTMIFLATKFAGNRRMICPNYLVDESELAIVYHHDVFTAHQLASSRPYSGLRTYEALCRVNEDWVRPFFPAFAARLQSGERVDDVEKETESPWQRASELALAATGTTLERGLRWAWRVRLRRRAVGARASGVVLGRGIMKLHLSDYRQRTLDRFASRLAALRVQIDEVAAETTGVEPVGT
jgi:hypothetical protein